MSSDPTSSDPTSSVPLDVDPYDVSAVIGMFAEGICWGFYTFLVFSCLLMLHTLKKRNRVTVGLTAVTVGLYTICTAHFAVYMNQVVVNLWTSGIQGVSYANRATVFGDLLSSLACFFGDLTLIYRLWLFYGTYRWRAPLAIFVCLVDSAGLVIAIYCTVILNNVASNIVPADPDTFVRLLVAYNAIPLCTNALISALIFGRALYLWKQLTWAPSLGPRASRALTIILETGLVFLVVQVLVVVFHLQESSNAIVVSGVVAQIYGIVPTFITAGIAFGLLAENPQDPASSSFVGTLTIPNFHESQSTAYDDYQKKNEDSLLTPDRLFPSDKVFESTV